MQKIAKLVSLSLLVSSVDNFVDDIYQSSNNDKETMYVSFVYSNKKVSWPVTISLIRYAEDIVDLEIRVYNYKRNKLKSAAKYSMELEKGTVVLWKFSETLNPIPLQDNIAKKIQDNLQKIVDDLE